LLLVFLPYGWFHKRWSTDNSFYSSNCFVVF
jgi:hypothetical protein